MVQEYFVTFEGRELDDGYDSNWIYKKINRNSKFLC